MAKKSNKPPAGARLPVDKTGLSVLYHFFITFEVAVPKISALPMNDLRFLENISDLESGVALWVYSVVRGMLKTSGVRLKPVPVFKTSHASKTRASGEKTICKKYN